MIHLYLIESDIVSSSFNENGYGHSLKMYASKMLPIA